MEKKASNGIHKLHYSIAEHGKIMALKNCHKEALRHYREAIRMAASCGAPEVFFRHYSQCVLESLELTGSHQEVIEFCRKADEHYQTLQATTNPLHRKDHGSLLERCGVNHLKAGSRDEALSWLNRAIECAGAHILPLAEELMQWLLRGLVVNEVRLLSLQKKHHYFVVREGQVDRSLAQPLDSMRTPLGLGTALLKEK